MIVDPEDEPEAAQGAAHEIGHAIVSLTGGLPVTKIVFNARTGVGVTSVDVRLTEQTDPEVWSVWLVGCLAGYEAELLWAAQHCGTVHTEHSGIDFAAFRRHRHRVGLTEAEARRAARQILRRHWTQVERRAPELAERGRLAPALLKVSALSPVRSERRV